MKRIVSGLLGLAFLVALGGCAATQPKQGQDLSGGPSPTTPKAIGGTADSGGVIGR